MSYVIRAGIASVIH